MNVDFLNKMLAAGASRGASDIHLKVDRSPMFRIDGLLREIKAPKLSASDTLQIVAAIFSKNGIRDVDLKTMQEYDTSYTLEGTGRYRVNIYRQRGTLSIILRIIPIDIPTIKGLQLPGAVQKIAGITRGMVLVTGVTGSGKSSTLAAIINHINQNRSEHILTLEDPIEFVHQDQMSSVSQREIGPDSSDFSTALRAALRQDPDVILVGEMRDFETIDIALKAAETGHLVLSTVHTTDAAKTIGRLVGVFPSEQQEGARLRIAETLQATISQRLIAKADGTGRIAAAEIMRTNMSIQEAIRDPDKTSSIKDTIARGFEQGESQTFDQHLTALYKKKLVTLEAARAAASNPTDFERALSFD